MEITAKEIERQAGRLEEQAQKYEAALHKIISNLHTIHYTVKSADSALGSRAMDVANSYIRYQGNAKQKFENLAQKMHNYAAKTLTNEETATSDMSAIDNELEALNS